ELEKLGLPPPNTPSHDPISLRLRALHGDEIKPEELHAALTHLFKRRGYSKVPWANVEIEVAASGVDKSRKNDDEGQIKEAVKAIKEKLSGKHPCQLLGERRKEVGKTPTDSWARKIYWPREALRDEFLAILNAQKKRFPKPAENVDWLLYGDSH